MYSTLYQNIGHQRPGCHDGKPANNILDSVYVQFCQGLASAQREKMAPVQLWARHLHRSALMRPWLPIILFGFISVYDTVVPTVHQPLT